MTIIGKYYTSPADGALVLGADTTVADDVCSVDIFFIGGLCCFLWDVAVAVDADAFNKLDFLADDSSLAVSFDDLNQRTQTMI